MVQLLPLRHLYFHCAYAYLPLLHPQSQMGGVGEGGVLIPLKCEAVASWLASKLMLPSLLNPMSSSLCSLSQLNTAGNISSQYSHCLFLFALFQLQWDHRFFSFLYNVLLLLLVVVVIVVFLWILKMSQMWTVGDPSHWSYVSFDMSLSHFDRRHPVSYNGMSHFILSLSLLRKQVLIQDVLFQE